MVIYFFFILALTGILYSGVENLTFVLIFSTNYAHLNYFIMNFDSTLNINVWLSEANSILQILLTGFFLGIIALIRIFIYLIIQVFKFHLWLILLKFEKISGLKLKMPSIYFSKVTQARLARSEIMLLPFSYFIENITFSLREHKIFYCWKYEIKEDIFKIIIAPKVFFDLSFNGRKNAPEFLDKKTGKPIELIDKDYYYAVKAYSQTNSVEELGTFLKNNPTKYNHHIAVGISSEKTVKIGKETKDQGLEKHGEILGETVNTSFSYDNIKGNNSILLGATISEKNPCLFDIQLPQNFNNKSAYEKELYFKNFSLKNARVFGENQNAIISATNAINKTSLEESVVVVRAAQNIERKLDTLSIYTKNDHLLFFKELAMQKMPLSIKEITNSAKIYNLHYKIIAEDSMMLSGVKNPVIGKDQVNLIAEELINIKLLPFSVYCTTDSVYKNKILALTEEGHTYRINIALNISSSEKFITNIQEAVNNKITSQKEFKFLRDAKVEVLVSKVPEQGASYIDFASIMETISKPDLDSITIL